MPALFLQMSMLQPQPHEGPPQAARDRQTIQNLRILVNRAESRSREMEKERDLARWQAILDRNKIAALEAEAEGLHEELVAMAGELEELRARIAERPT